MASEEEGFFGISTERDPAITRGIFVVFDGKIGDFGCEPFACLQPGVGPGDSLRSVFVRGERAQFFQLGDSAFRIDNHRR